MEVEDTTIPDVRFLKVRYFTDPRGSFVETYSKRVARDLGLTCCFVQDNLSLSIKRGTVRALHFQIPPKCPDYSLLTSARASMTWPSIFAPVLRLTAVGWR